MTEESKSKGYSELLLGDSMDIILQATQEAIPVIAEDRFINEVLPLLETPFRLESMSRYVSYVGELTNPLRVQAADGEILFEVPAFIQTTGVTIPIKGAATTDHALKDIYGMAERGVDINPHITALMRSVTARPDMVERVLNPLDAILKRYGRTIQIDDEAVVAEGVAVEPTKPAPPENTGDSFTGEYE